MGRLDSRKAGAMEAEARVKSKPSEIVHDLRNAATSVSLALHSLSRSAEVRSNAGQVRLRIANQELETIRHLLDELQSIEGER